MSRRAARVRLDSGEIDTILGLLGVEIEAEQPEECGSGDLERMRHLGQLYDKMARLAVKVAGRDETSNGG